MSYSYLSFGLRHHLFHLVSHRPERLLSSFDRLVPLILLLNVLQDLSEGGEGGEGRA
jgi:hypothetical protein